MRVARVRRISRTFELELQNARRRNSFGLYVLQRVLHVRV